MDSGETIRQVAIREAREETGLDVVLSKQKPWKSKFEHRDEYYFFVDKTRGKCRLGGPEAMLNNEENKYGLEWVWLGKLEKVNLVPSDIKQFLILNFEFRNNKLISNI
jgi:8-oxo-dGTP pyrophosphatase MutT (NUDIX family)